MEEARLVRRRIWGARLGQRGSGGILNESIEFVLLFKRLF